MSSLDRAPAYRLARVARLLRHDLQRLLDAHAGGISQEQYFLLYRLHERDGQPQRALTDPAFDDRANITRLVDGLAERGLVERRPDPEDGRRSLVFLTTDGRGLVDRLLPHVQDERERLWSCLSAAELDTLLTLVERVERRLACGRPICCLNNKGETMTEDVTETIRRFVHGADVRDADAVRAALHPAAVQIVRRGDTDLRVDVETYLAMLADGRVGGTPRELVVHAVDARGGVATATATAISAAMRFEQAYLLARGPDGWRIVSMAAEVALS